MRLNKSTKYWLSTGGLGLVIILVIKYVMGAMHQPSDGSRRMYYIVMGIVLFAMLALVSIMRTYYRRDRDAVVDESLLGSELTAQGLIASDKHKHITVQIKATTEELQLLTKAGELTLPADRFTGPVRTGDTVRLQGESRYQQYVYGVLDTIDGVNRKMLIKHLTQPPVSHRVDS
jgi:hypothetical protein